MMLRVGHPVVEAGAEVYGYAEIAEQQTSEQSHRHEE